jgi:hypothetical protein
MANFIEAYPVGTELSHAEGRSVEQTDSGSDIYNEYNCRFSKFLERA